MTAPLPFDPARLGLSRFTASPLPVLVQKPADDAHAARRTKIWELAPSLHCSIIGTCLSAGELRRIIAKTNLPVAGKTDHELHGQGVTLASKHAGPAKLLHKALDDRHRLSLKRFDRAKTEDDLRALWGEARTEGDIPGAYWAVLTHPAATNQLIRDVFADVHMLSHLVGAANRADIRRLSALEAEKAALEDKVQRQQAQLHEFITRRDARIRELSALVAARLATEHEAEPSVGGDALAALVADLQRRLAAEQRRSAVLEERRARSRAELLEERALREAAERRERLVAGELEALEASLAEARGDGTAASLDGLAVLYVGGHPSLVGHMRAASERQGALFAHHDGGVDERNALLSGLVSRADLVLFPVDCISHDAALAVKRLCRQLGKPFLPLRSGGLASFVSALRRQDPVACPSSGQA